MSLSLKPSNLANTSTNASRSAAFVFLSLKKWRKSSNNRLKQHKYYAYLLQAKKLIGNNVEHQIKFQVSQQNSCVLTKKQKS